MPLASGGTERRRQDKQRAPSGSETGGQSVSCGPHSLCKLLGVTRVPGNWEHSAPANAGIRTRCCALPRGLWPSMFTYVPLSQIPASPQTPRRTSSRFPRTLSSQQAFVQQRLTECSHVLSTALAPKTHALSCASLNASHLQVPPSENGAPIYLLGEPGAGSHPRPVAPPAPPSTTTPSKRTSNASPAQSPPLPTLSPT